MPFAETDFAPARRRSESILENAKSVTQLIRIIVSTLNCNTIALAIGKAEKIQKGITWYEEYFEK